MTHGFGADFAYAGASFGNWPDSFIKEIRMRISTRVLGTAAIFLALPTFAHDLTLNVDNIKSAEGDLLIAVYDKEESYNVDANWVAVRKIAMAETVMVVNFTDLPTGNYAIKLFQDKNRNSQIDKNTVGIPTEPYGFSNNGGAFGQPSFNEAKVLIDKATQIDIHLR
jgi:uncharacterized protein (DUF2141 family)